VICCVSLKARYRGLSAASDLRTRTTTSTGTDPVYASLAIPDANVSSFMSCVYGLLSRKMLVCAFWIGCLSTFWTLIESVNGSTTNEVDDPPPMSSFVSGVVVLNVLIVIAPSEYARPRAPSSRVATTGPAGMSAPAVPQRISEGNAHLGEWGLLPQW